MSQTVVRAPQARGVSCTSGPIATSPPVASVQRRRESPPKPVPLEPWHYIKGLQMPGEGSRKVFCGQYQSAVACPRGASGAVRLRVGQKGHSVTVRPKTCSRATCEVCWESALRRMVERTADKIEAVQALYGLPNVRHFTFSPPQDVATARFRAEGVAYLPKMYRFLYAMLRRNGLHGGAVVFHPWRCNGSGKDRYRTSPRRLSPHFHVMAWGKVEHTKRLRQKEGGWVVYNHDAKRPEGRDRGQQIRTLLYLLDHCGLEVGSGRTGDAVRYFGTASKVAREKGPLRVEQVPCESCGEPCHVYPLQCETDDAEGVEVKWDSMGEAEHKVRVWVYRRSKGCEGPPGAPEEYVIGEAEETGFTGPLFRQAPLGGAAA